MEQRWKKGDLSMIARQCGISNAHLSNMLRGKRVPHPQVAKRVSAAAIRLGYNLTVWDLLFHAESQNPLLTKGE